jgi:predicted aspartyl protease
MRKPAWPEPAALLHHHPPRPGKNAAEATDPDRKEANGTWSRGWEQLACGASAVDAVPGEGEQSQGDRSLSVSVPPPAGPSPAALLAATSPAKRERWTRAIRAALVGLLLGAVPAAACQVQPRAVVPLEIASRHAIVTVKVNNQPASFILDTGAERTMVTVAAVQRLGLDLDQLTGTTVMGIGGLVRHQNALPRSLTLGGVALRHPTLLRDSTLAVGPLPISSFDGQRIDGLLGRDFLSAFDLSLDIPGRRLTLYDVRDCQGTFLPWTKQYRVIAALPAYGKALAIPTQLDGQWMRTLIDTGAGTSILTAPGIARLGLTPASLVGDPVAMAHGVGDRPVPVRLHRFGALNVGGGRTPEPTLLVAPVRVVPTVELVLGDDWLQSHRVWLSYSTLQVFVAAD